MQRQDQFLQGIGSATVSPACPSKQTNKDMLLRSDPGAQIVPGDNGIQASQGGGRHSLDQGSVMDEQYDLESPVHPLGIKPSGNKLLSTGTPDAREAIGAFQALPDGTDLLRLWISKNGIS